VVSFTDDFVLKPIETVYSFSLLTKIHVGVGLLTCVACFLVWHYIAPDPSTSFWWWIYPWFCFAMTLSAQLHYQREQYWRGIIITVILLNFMIFLTDGLTSEGFPKWWIYPAAASAMALIAIYAWKYEGFSQITTAFYEYLIANVLFFLVWLENTHDMFPWWIIPMFILAIPLVIVYMRNAYTEYRIWLYLIVSLILIDVMIFLVWGFVDSDFPWFLLLWGASVVAIVFLFWKNKNNIYEVVPDKPSEVSTSGATGQTTTNNTQDFYDPWSITTQEEKK